MATCKAVIKTEHDRNDIAELEDDVLEDIKSNDMNFADLEVFVACRRD
jgi:hypothetical protein